MQEEINNVRLRGSTFWCMMEQQRVENIDFVMWDEAETSEGNLSGAKEQHTIEETRHSPIPDIYHVVCFTHCQQHSARTYPAVYCDDHCRATVSRFVANACKLFWKYVNKDKKNNSS